MAAVPLHGPSFRPPTGDAPALTLRAALGLVSSHLFTPSGRSDWETVGMVGLNVPIGLPLALRPEGVHARRAEPVTSARGLVLSEAQDPDHRWPEQVNGAEFTMPTLRQAPQGQ